MTLDESRLAPVKTIEGVNYYDQREPVKMSACLCGIYFCRACPVVLHRVWAGWDEAVGIREGKK